MDGSIPIPVSDMEMTTQRTWRLFRRAPDACRRRGARPCGIASRALNARLSTARSSSARSTRTRSGELTPSVVISTSTCGPKSLRRSSLIAVITSEASVSTSCRLLLLPDLQQADR